jgi:DNA-binding LytR/AlgR family response regulator
MKLTIAVCEDESLPLKINCTYIEELSKKYKVDASIVGFTSGEAALAYMNKEEIDIIFMDIDLKGMNGIQTASMLLKRNPRIITIFVTGHKEFAYDAFTVEAFSFLIKPIDSERLERIFKKALLQFSDLNYRKQRAPLIITEDNLKKKINQSSILYIERVDAQSVIVTKSSRHYVYETITSLSERLENNFIRINQGIIVNLSEVEGLVQRALTLKSGEEFSVGRTYLKEVKRKYLEYPHI